MHFRLVDRFLELTDSSAVAVKNVTAAEEYLGADQSNRVRCPRCRNYTLGDVAYKGYTSRRIKYATICLSCDSVKSWPRMEAA
jgi:hypothetical protein